MKLQIKEKAYQIDFSQIDEGYLWGEQVCHAESLGKAKVKLLPEVEGAKTHLFRDEITYLNIPVIRAKEYDRIVYKGEIINRSRVKYIKRIEENDKKLDEILNDSSITHCYKMKRGVYYGWNNSGYVSFKHVAGVYPKKETVNYCKGQLDVTCVPIDTEEHNEIILNHIARVKKGLIK